MAAFRVLLALIFVCVLTYTGIVISNHGWGLFEIFFGDISAMTWPGQFNLDFSCFLILSGLWLAWRHQFSVPGTVLGLLIIVGGVPLFSGYLLWATFKTNGNMHEILLGKERAAQQARS
jgi:hypothetical protein